MTQRAEHIYIMIDKLMKYGWYKDIKDIKQIKRNYLENYPLQQHNKNQEESNKIQRDTIYIDMHKDRILEEDSTEILEE